MKRIALCLLPLLLLCGCKITYDTLPADSARLPRGAAVAGVALSGQSVSRSRSALLARFGAPVLTLVLPDREIRQPAEAFGVGYDIDGALLAAFNGTEPEAIPLRVDTKTLPDACAAFAEAYSSPCADAAVDFVPDAADGGYFVYTPEQPGLRIDAEALADAVSGAAAAGSLRAAVPCTSLEPGVTVDALQSTRTRICTFSTSFSGASLGGSNRVYNIKKAAALLHGTVLEPGQEFDCNAALGDRNVENGWREAAGIRGGAYIEEYGGGVCQVSSTLFNAVLMADLPVTERAPHSWPMGYVDIGRDATISTGGKNFRFRNTSGHALTIVMRVDPAAQTLTCELYGAPLPGGQSIRISSERTGTLDPLPCQYRLDESLPYNTRVVEREGRTGKTSRTYREYVSADGVAGERELLYEDVYRSIASIEIVSPDLYERLAQNS